MTGITHRAFNSRMGYFLWLNASTNTINVAKEIANINDSNTVIGTTPFRTEVSRPPLSHLFYYSSIIPYIRSSKPKFHYSCMKDLYLYHHFYVNIKASKKMPYI